jgi:hypothetical protein
MASPQPPNDRLRIAMTSHQPPSDQQYDRPAQVRPLGPYYPHLGIASLVDYDQKNCALCRRRLGRGPIKCERCCSEIHDRCYWKIATAVERLSFDCDIIIGIFLCQGCRS